MKTTTEARSGYDAIVVGARVAGAATAMLLARAGRRVLVLDRSAPGRDTLSTHALMRPGVLRLQRWGLLDRILAAGTPPIRSTTFHYDAEAIEVAIRPRDGVDALYAPRRTVIDVTLAEAAAEAGAEIVYGARVLDLIRDGRGGVAGVTYEDAGGSSRTANAAIVIGADGLRSTVASRVDAPVVAAGRHATAVVYGYWRGLGLEGTHWYYAPGASAGAIPTNGGEWCVFVSVPASRYAETRAAGPGALLEKGLAEANADLARRVLEGERSGVLHAFPGQPGYIRRSWGRGWALVGDAGFFKDPLTAHGMTDALRDAELLARAILRGGARALRDYQRRRDELAREMLELTDGVASFAWGMDELKRLHHRLSRHMAKEQEVLSWLDAERDARRALVPAA
ncbi:MAG TPA: NAD(P)/FAD-dependent oxidoreductase [Candidatus Eisenbacteria bacterium]|nr:NAD(P)/FAD-dependent oxidoreductase [Candidatus Eisenbacteria bacterium]